MTIDKVLATLLVGMLLIVGCGSSSGQPGPAPTVAAPTPQPTAALQATDTPAALAPTAEPTQSPMATAAATLARTPTPTSTSAAVSQGTATPRQTVSQTQATTRTQTALNLQATPRVEVVAAGLQIPWALAFAPDGRIFCTERPGRLRVIEQGALKPEPVAMLNVATVGEGGLLGLVLDPDFSNNGYLYMMYTYWEGSTPRNRISRFTLQGTGIGNEQVLLQGIPAERNHDGGRVKIGPDGKLYATTGDALQPSQAQDKSALGGKVLRLNLDGSIPADNPFPGSPVYTFGNRNPEGLAWQSGSGRLYETEHGPSGEMGLCCHDEVNLIVPGGNYGWPVVIDSPGDPRFLDPVLQSGNDTWAPAGAAFYEGTLFPAWSGDFFFGALRGQHLHRLRFGGADGRTIVQDERLFEGQFGRIRDVVVGPDGAIYLTTSNQDGRGSPAPDDDRILRVVPQ